MCPKINMDLYIYFLLIFEHISHSYNKKRPILFETIEKNPSNKKKEFTTYCIEVGNSFLLTTYGKIFLYSVLTRKSFVPFAKSLYHSSNCSGVIT